MLAEAVRPQRTSWAPVVALGLAMLVVTSEMTIAAVTLPGIGADLQVTPAATAWVLLAYALPLLASTFTGGLASFLLPFYVADVLGAGPDVTGVALLFFVGVMAPLSAAAGALADRLGTRVVAIAGGAVSVAAMFLMLALDADSGLADMAWRLIVLGGGAALYNPAINAAMLAGAPVGTEGVAGASG
jgi:hypothetical protein